MSLVAPSYPGLTQEESEVFGNAAGVAETTKRTNRRIDLTEVCRLCVAVYGRWQRAEHALVAERAEVSRLNSLISTYRQALVMSGINMDALEEDINGRQLR